MATELGDELVALDPDEGLCFGFNSVARRIWELLDEPRSSEQLERSLLEEFDVTAADCASGVGEVMAELTRLKLVKPVDRA
jgi:hypothetical protein